MSAYEPIEHAEPCMQILCFFTGEDLDKYSLVNLEIHTRDEETCHWC